MASDKAANEARQGGTLMGLIGGSAVVNMAFMVYVGGRLGPEEAGAFYSALFSVFFLCTALMAINGTVARFASLYLAHDQPGHMTALRRRMFRWLALLNGVTVLTYLGLGSLVEQALRFPSRWVLPAVLATFIANTWLAPARGMLRGHQRFALFGWSFMLEALPRVALMVPVLFLTARTDTAVAVYGLGTVVAAAFAQWSARPDPSVPPCPPARDFPLGELRTYLLLLVVMVATRSGFINADMLLARRHFEGDLVGAYGAAATMAKGIEVVGFAVTGLMLPLLTDAFARGASLRRPFLRMLAQFGAMCAPPMAAFYLVPGPFINLLYGARFAGGASFLWPHGISALLTTLTDVLCQLYNAVGRFGFLVPLVAGLLLEVVAATLYHPSLAAMLWLVCGVKAATLVAVTLPLLSQSKNKP